MTCIFCEIATSDPKGQALDYYTTEDLLGTTSVTVIEPLNPCVEGHLLFIPEVHLERMGSVDPENVVASTMKAVNLYLAERPDLHCNVIANNGTNADQTVHHLHVHIIPRTAPNDSVKLPWSYQQKH